MRMKKPERQRFGKNLVAARKAAKISQEDLAFRCGLHRTAISLLERGKREPRASTLVKLTSALGEETTANDLLAGISWLPEQSHFALDKAKRKAKAPRR
jgi:transcriptional regulator with XRE-family HTH domain